MQSLLPGLSRVTSRGLAFLAVFALLLPLASGAMAQTPVELPPLDGDTESRAFAINDRGEVAGVSSGSGGGMAVVWDRSGTPRVLPPLAGDSRASARAINNRGEVVGSSFGSDVNTAVVWR